jgi:hypothetical protein
LVIAGIAIVASVAAAVGTGRQNLDTAGFWASVYLEATEAEHYDSLPEMRDAADAVVLGSITAVTPGRTFAFPPDDVVQYVTALVQVDRVLSGEVRKDSSGHVLLEVLLPNPQRWRTTLLPQPLGVRASSFCGTRQLNWRI